MFRKVEAKIERGLIYELRILCFALLYMQQLSKLGFVFPSSVFLFRLFSSHFGNKFPNISEVEPQNSAYFTCNLFHIFEYIFSIMEVFGGQKMNKTYHLAWKHAQPRRATSINTTQSDSCHNRNLPKVPAEKMC